ncbi:F-box protein [Morus notabilis]|uniref:F-box protein n=2 Tax=Morus notabilis TaxID=981085 RepID=W9R8T1_9ROSA|nr:F-box protein [Morus notabilis]
MANSLPWEIIADILSRLAVKDLLRYRCVSKPWCSLIDGPDFIKLHLKQSLETTSHHRVIFGDRTELYWVDLVTLDSAVRLPYPIDIGRGIDVLGGCNGLVALANKGGDVAIWNPSTRSYRTLLISEHEFYFLSDSFEFVMSGFGYDPIADDHKLLMKMFYTLVDEEPQDLDYYSEVEIYSVKAQTWKKVDDFPDHFVYRPGSGVVVGRALHWSVIRRSDTSNWIFAFDLVAEDHRELALPDDKDVKTSRMKLVNLGGCLCFAVLCNYNQDSKKSDRVDVWVMREYGVKESWSKLFSVAPSSVTGPFWYVVPVAYLKGGDRILLDQDGEKFLLYDVKRKRVKKLRGSSFPRIFDTLVCVGSLVGLDGDDGEGSGKKAGKKRKGKEQSDKKR